MTINHTAINNTQNIWGSETNDFNEHNADQNFMTKYIYIYICMEPDDSPLKLWPNKAPYLGPVGTRTSI